MGKINKTIFWVNFEFFDAVFERDHFTSGKIILLASDIARVAITPVISAEAFFFFSSLASSAVFYLAIQQPV